MTEAPTMPKKPAKPKEENRDALVAVRCKPSWKVWLERFARRERVTPTQLVDMALASLATARGFEEPPER